MVRDDGSYSKEYIEELADNSVSPFSLRDLTGCSAVPSVARLGRCSGGPAAGPCGLGIVWANFEWTLIINMGLTN